MCDDDDSIDSKQSASKYIIHFGYNNGGTKFDIPHSLTVNQYDAEDNNQEGMVEIDKLDNLRPGACEGVCIGCSSPYRADDILFTDNAIIYDDDHAKKIKVYGRKCINSECNHIVLPDPVCDGIYNHSGYSLFTTSVLNKYTTLSTSGSFTFKGYHKFVVGEYDDYAKKRNKSARSLPLEPHLPFCSQKLLQQAWAKFIHRQNWKFLFSCPFGCGCEPDIIIVDGYRLCLPKEFIKNLQTPIKTHSTKSPIYHFHYKKTSYIEFEKIAKLLSLFCGKTDRTEASSSMTTSQYEDLMKHLVVHYQYVNQIIANLSKEHHEVQQVLKRILKILSYMEHILGLIPNSSIKLLEDYLNDENVYSSEWIDKLFVLSPVMAELIIAYRESAKQTIPEYVKNFIYSLIAKAKIVLRGSMPPEVEDINDDDEDDDDDENDDDENGEQNENIDIDDVDYRDAGCYYGASRKRFRPIYPKIEKKKKDKEGRVHTKDKITCTKYDQSVREMSGGVLIIWCK